MSKAKIDFKKYRSTELLQSLTDLIDVRGIYARSILKILLVALITVILVIVCFWNRCSFPILSGTVVAGFFAGCIIGALYAIITVIRQSLGNMIMIVDRLLELTKTVAGDVRAMTIGETEMPTAAQLVKGVYGEVVLPMVETVIREKLGAAGRPVMFLYRMTLGQLVRLSIRMLPAAALTWVSENKSAERVAGEVMESMPKVAVNEDKIVASLSFVQGKINSISHGLRFLIMLPGYAFFAAVVVFILCFFVLAWVLLEPQAATEQPETAYRLFHRVS